MVVVLIHLCDSQTISGVVLDALMGGSLRISIFCFISELFSWHCISPIERQCLTSADSMRQPFELRRVGLRYTPAAPAAGFI